MAEPNLCDLRCPRKTMMGVRYRLDMAQQSNPFAKLFTSVNVGLEGAGQAARAAMSCPSRDLPDGQWSASPECIAAAQQMADRTPVRRTELSGQESAALSQVKLAGDPPAVSG